MAFERLKIHVEVDPPNDLERVEIAAELARYISDKYGMDVFKFQLDDLQDEEWRDQS